MAMGRSLKVQFTPTPGPSAPYSNDVQVADASHCFAQWIWLLAVVVIMASPKSLATHPIPLSLKSEQQNIPSTHMLSTTAIWFIFRMILSDYYSEFDEFL